MAARNVKIGDYTVPLYAGKIVRRLDDFPELVQALRNGDSRTGRLFCAQLFACNGRRSRVGKETPALRP